MMGKVVTLGEVMLRLSTETGVPLTGAHQFQAHYGGAEANVGISLANWGHEVDFASKVPGNALGWAVKRHLDSYGVSTEHLLFGGERLGTYYVEAGVGERAARIIYDRAHSSFTEMTLLEWDLERLFEEADLLHLSGITLALSEHWEALLMQLMQMAKNHGVKISFDINYRGKLWSPKEAGETIHRILPYVDYCSAGKMDALYLLGREEYQGDGHELTDYYQQMQGVYPNIQLFYSTQRTIHSASAHTLVGTLWMDGQYYESRTHEMDPIVDRVGGGDAFSAGILHGILEGTDAQTRVEFATASALKHTVLGDCNPFRIADVEAFMAMGSGRINR